MCGWGAAGVGKASPQLKGTQRPPPPSPQGSFGAEVGGGRGQVVAGGAMDITLRL